MIFSLFSKKDIALELTLGGIFTLKFISNSKGVQNVLFCRPHG